MYHELQDFSRVNPTPYRNIDIFWLICYNKSVDEVSTTTRFMIIKDTLEELGFAEKETLLYLAILELGSATVRELAKKVDLNRTTCYDILALLMKRGLVSKFKKKGKTFFQATDPRRLVSYLDREKEESAKRFEDQKQKLAAVMPEFLSMLAPSSTRPKVQFFEGEKGMREAYEDTLTTKETILAYANIETMYQGLPHFFPEYFSRRAVARIKIRAIFPDDPRSRKQSERNNEELRETRFLPRKEMTFSPEINIYENKILLVSWKEKIAILIESKELAELQKLIFGITWDALSI